MPAPCPGRGAPASGQPSRPRALWRRSSQSSDALAPVLESGHDALLLGCAATAHVIARQGPDHKATPGPGHTSRARSNSVAPRCHLRLHPALVHGVVAAPEEIVRELAPPEHALSRAVDVCRCAPKGDSPAYGTVANRSALPAMLIMCSRIWGSAPASTGPRQGSA